MFKYIKYKRKAEFLEEDIKDLKAEIYDLKEKLKKEKERNEIERSAIKIIRNLSSAKKRELGIIGGNGTGKSTLLKTLMGMQNPISGKIDFGHNIEIGYFDQKMAEINSNKTIYEDFSEEFPELTVTEVRNSLAAFMFYGDDVFKEINMLSGWEKVRFALCKILKKGSNVLILDEPTNHMDIVGKETLENLLKEYQGTIIFVSHDRFFVKKIADSILAFENGEVHFYKYGYDEYLEKSVLLNQEQTEEIADLPTIYFQRQRGMVT